MVSIGNFIKRIAGSHGRHLERAWPTTFFLHRCVAA
jgi:hypothetical protein